MRTWAVVGFSETGKTRLVSALIRELKGRGLRVSAVKRCDHGFSLDVEGKDSDVFRCAGADGVALVSGDGWAALEPDPPDDLRALAARLFPRADIVLVEGGKGVRGIPKIEVLRKGVSERLVSPRDELRAVVADFPLSPDPGVPVHGPKDIPALGDLILSEEDRMTVITLEVDGREINLNEFVRTFIERTVLGMVTSLSGVDPEPKRISLVIERAGGAPRAK